MAPTPIHPPFFPLLTRGAGLDLGDLKQRAFQVGLYSYLQVPFRY